MAKLLSIGETGRARFSDGTWALPDAPTLKESSARAGSGAFEPKSVAETALHNHPTLHPDGPFSLMMQLPKGFTYSVQEHEGEIMLMRRSNAPAAKTSDRATEYDRIQAIQDRNRRFWAKPNPPRKPTSTPGAA